MGYLSAADSSNPKFTGKNRDGETYLDWYEVRYLSGAQGRFQSVDPGNAGADPSNPQTWNAYSYVGNNPLSYTDPSGKSWITGLFAAAAFAGGFFSGGATVPLAIDLIEGAVAGAEVAGAQLSLEKAVDSGNIAGIVGAFLGGPAEIPDYGGGYIFDFEDQYKNGRRVLPDGDLEIWGHFGQGQTIIRQLSKRIDKYPNVCSVGLTARVGPPTAWYSLGFDINSSKAYGLPAALN